MKLIYFDNASSTKIDPFVLNQMILFMKQKNNFGNVSSTHCYGFKLRIEHLNSKYKISKLIHAKYDEIIFTSNATESNNLALKGLIKKNNIILTNKLEHNSIINVCNSFKKKNVIFVKHQKNGFIKCIDIIFKISINVTIISIAHVNNEIGTTQNINSIGNICKIFRIKFHTDATQSIGKRYMNVKLFNIDLLSFSSHKIHGPVGIGALYIKKTVQKMITPLIVGGNQEFNIRAGSISTVQVIGFSAACEILQNNFPKIRYLILNLRNYFLTQLLKIKNIDLIIFKHQIPDIINISIRNINIIKLIGSLKGIAISFGSACNSEKKIPNIIAKFKLIKNYNNSIRISLSKYNTTNEIDIFIKQLKKSILFFKKK